MLLWEYSYTGENVQTHPGSLTIWIVLLESRRVAVQHHPARPKGALAGRQRLDQPRLHGRGKRRSQGVVLVKHDSLGGMGDERVRGPVLPCLCEHRVIITMIEGGTGKG